MSVNDPMMESKHHLPECTLPKGHGDCICGELREAEQRGYENGCIHGAAKYPDIYSDGVKAAREAVAAVACGPQGSSNRFWRDRVIAAIDALEKP
jgi:hypothetical protein